MKTVSFYSYKGGVGRSLAVAYTARYLAQRNIGVCVLDIDLEAPGIVYKFPEKTELVISKLGVVDYVHSCISTDKAPENIEEYFSTIYQKNQFGYIKVMNAGKGIDTNEYWSNLSGIDWNELFLKETGEGLLIFENLKWQIKNQINPDYLLIDSRSGVTIMGKVCNSVLPDKVVMLLANNAENFHGSKMMYNHISNSLDYKVDKVKSDIICAITRFPTNEDESDITKRLSMLDTTMEANIKDSFYQMVDNPSLVKDDIFIIHSDRDVERNELSILSKSQIAERKIIGEDYATLIRRFVDAELLKKRESLNIKAPKYRFTEYDLLSAVENELKKFQGNLEFEEFYSELTKAKNQSLDSSSLLFKLALCERYSGNIENAIMNLYSSINNASEGDEWRISSHYWRGVFFLYDLNNYDASLKDLEWVYNSNNSFNAHICYDLSLCYFCRNNFAKAAEFIDRYIVDNEYDYRAFLLRANINEGKLRGRNANSERKKIISDYDSAIKLNTNFVSLYNCRGLFYYNLGEQENALKDYNKAIEMDPNYKLAYKNRGDVYFDLGQLENALKDYDRAIEIDSDYASAYNRRGDVYSDLGKTRKALSDYEKAYAINPSSAYLSLERMRKPTAYYKALEVNLQYDNWYYCSDNIVAKYRFPVKYHEIDDFVEFALIEKDDRILLIDQGKTLKMLDKLFELNERDVTKNISAILKEFRVFKNGMDFSIELRAVKSDDDESKALHEAKYRLFRCVSFIDKMAIFYMDHNNEFQDGHIFDLLGETKNKKDSQNVFKTYSFPAKYYLLNEEYEFALIKKDDAYYITDQGKTYIMLDKVFELRELDVQKNLSAIMKKFQVLQFEGELLIKINTWDGESSAEENMEIEEAKHKLFECVSFMDTMRIFYV